MISLMPPEIQLRIYKLGKLKELYRDDPEFCARQDARIAALQKIQEVRESIEQKQIRRAARYKRLAFSRSYRGTCRAKKEAFWMWSHARNSLYFQGALK